jgi:Na+/H+-dicarboxylate symporter
MARMNVLGVIVFSLLFGAALSAVGERGKTVVSFFDGVNTAILKLIEWVLHLLPLGVFGLVLGRLAETGGGDALWTELSRVGYYALTVISGLTIHGFIILPLVLWLFTRRNPLTYAMGMFQALLTAFSTLFFPLERP